MNEFTYNGEGKQESFATVGEVQIVARALRNDVDHLDRRVDEIDARYQVLEYRIDRLRTANEVLTSVGIFTLALAAVAIVWLVQL